jgi:hypothetical protein
LPDEVLARAPLDNGHINARQSQLTRQHEPRRAYANDQYIGIRHARHLTCVFRGRGGTSKAKGFAILELV